jgi:hypothetical protein
MQVSRGLLYSLGPPMPENGGLPTIIVTPAEPSSTQDFEIHFVSPKASQTTFRISYQSQGILPRMRSFFRRPTEQSSLLEKADYFSEEEEDIAEGRYVSVSVQGTGNGGYSAVPQSEVETSIPGVPTISERDWTTISAASTSNGYSTQTIMLVSSSSGASHRPSFITRRVRTLLFLSVPIALVAFHLISHHIGLFRVSGMDGAGMWTEEPSPLSGPVI